MSLGEYLSVPFLISLGITLLLVGIVGMFFTQRLQEQNHKINSMVGLVSTMAEEMSYLRNRLTQIGAPPNPVSEQISFEQNKLIEVSDGEYDSDSDNESESDQHETSSETDSDSDSVESDEDNQLTLLNEENEQSNIKVINIHDNNNDKPFEPILSELEELNNNDVDEYDNDKYDEYNDDESESSESVNLVELDSNNDLNSLDISSDNKNINVDLSVLDYKKLSLGKLRNIVIEKGLTKDASKLKKHDLLELLGF
jgi:hypothetical protein